MSEPLPPPSMPPPLPTNSVGTAGFVVSLVGIITCGFLSPIGLILSLVGLGKEPKGLAIAGTVIGGIGSLFLFIAGLGILAGLFVFLIPKGQEVETEMTLKSAVAVIEKRSAEIGELPTADEGRGLIAEFEDAWGRAVRYEPRRETFTIRSAGPDGAFDTADDVVLGGELWRGR